jgi:hypothetical protein
MPAPRGRTSGSHSSPSSEAPKPEPAAAQASGQNENRNNPSPEIGDGDLERLAEATWIEATGDGERVRLDLKLGNNVILARCYISNVKAKDLAFLLIRVSA